jgi:hypothetical protein
MNFSFFVTFFNRKIQILAPQGMPLRALDNKITDAFNQTSVINTNYGSIGPDPQDDAYDRYVSNPYG